MDSLFAQLFIALQERITAKVPDIRWIDQDLGQLEAYDIRPAVAWPCVLIDFDSSTYEDLSGGHQWGNLTFTLRLGFPPFSSANSLAPTAAKEAGLKYYELEHRLYQAIQGWDAAGIIQPATRTAMATEQRQEDTFRVRRLTFTTAFEDSSAAPVYTKVDRPALEFDFEV